MTLKQVLIGLCAYLLVISVAAIWMTLSDKKRAMKNKYRISESSLLVVALFGGAFAEYCAMRIIRHKTLHKKFMIGLPLIILLHLALAGVILYFIYLKH